MRNQKSLNSKTRIERVVFNAVTKHAVLEAIANPRALDMPLVEAYLVRGGLDYLLGYSLSPIIIRKLPIGATSAGRVQSPTLRLIVDREMEIEAFKAKEYWSIEASFLSKDGKLFEAQAIEFKGEFEIVL